MGLSNTQIPVEYGRFREQVLKGEIPVNQWISLEMNRIDYIIKSPEFYYDEDAIHGFIDFCENELTLENGEDVILLPTFRLWAECLLAWFYFIDEKIYNPVKKRYEIVQIKKRLVNKQYLIISRSNAKSLYSSFLHAYFLFIDTETTRQIVTAPTERDAYETMHPIATALTRARGPLFKFATEGRSVLSNTHSKVMFASTKKGIQNFLTNSILEFRPMTIDRNQGARSKMNSVDEWLSGKVKEDVIGAIEQGASKIDDYVIVATSSEGTYRGGPGDGIKLELQEILRGDYFNPHVSIFYYRLDDISEVGDPEAWIKANPNIGVTVSYDTIQKDVLRAENAPSARNDIIAKRFGIPLEGYTYFFPYEETIPFKRKRSYTGMICSMGADLSQGDDFCAFTFLFPLNNGKFGIKTRAYITDVKYKRLQSAMKIKYDSFIREGTLLVMEASYLDMIEVYDDLEQFILQKKYTVLSLGYDPYNANDFIDKWTINNGEYGVTIVRQGVKTESVPLGELKSLSTQRYLVFDEELMKFAMENTITIEDNNGNRKLSKRRAEDKIDNVSALMDAWVAYKRNQEAFE